MLMGLPLIRDTEPGISHELTQVDTDQPLAVPGGAIGVVLWFEDASETVIKGRFGIDQSADPVDPITPTNLAPHPATWTQHMFRTRQYRGKTMNAGDNHIHLACPVPATVTGYWLFADDDGE